LSTDGPARAGDWVEIHQVLLQPGERAPQVPAETQAVPLEMWVKGFLIDDQAARGDEVEIETVIGRRHRGALARVNPAYAHGFGEPTPELVTIGSELRQILGLPHPASTLAALAERRGSPSE